MYPTSWERAKCQQETVQTRSSICCVYAAVYGVVFGHMGGQDGDRTHHYQRTTLQFWVAALKQTLITSSHLPLCLYSLIMSPVPKEMPTPLSNDQNIMHLQTMYKTLHRQPAVTWVVKRWSKRLYRTVWILLHRSSLVMLMWRAWTLLQSPWWTISSFVLKTPYPPRLLGVCHKLCITPNLKVILKKKKRQRG